MPPERQLAYLGHRQLRAQLLPPLADLSPPLFHLLRRHVLSNLFLARDLPD
jgi:hypothetical protein